MWHPDSWHSLPLRQSARYPDPGALAAVTEQLRRLPPLVTQTEITSLQSQLADAAAGRRFLLQGGDCAERFVDCTSERITAKMKILLQMSLVLRHGLQVPIIRVGRIAGQYAKPRSDDDETRDGLTLPSYRGDLINDAAFTATARTPDPQRLLTGYTYASLTLNYLRALAENGYAELADAEHWNLDFMLNSPLAGSPQLTEYRHIVEAAQDGVRVEFIRNKIDADPSLCRERSEVFTCHEALHLHYESALTRRAADPAGRWYNFSTHLPWVGMRTADLHSAHVEYLRGIANPIAVKVGPGMTADALRALAERLNPDRIPGRLTLIHRFGVHRIADHLPGLVAAMQGEAQPVLWCCDPMHGNTQLTTQGLKTRHFDDILGELSQAFAIHRQLQSVLGGVHFELTGEAVTECIGGARGLAADDLERAYQSLVDPRLNGEQALEMALAIVRLQRTEAVPAVHQGNSAQSGR